MSNEQKASATCGNDQWLKQYYFTRAAFSVLWVAAALTAGQQSFAVAAALLIIYPAWDAAANVVDAARSGGFAVNRSQVINATASSIMTIAVILALMMNMNWVLGAFGLWAIFSGLLQLGAAAAWGCSSSLENKRRSVGDDIERWPIGVSGRALYLSSANAAGAFNLHGHGLRWCRGILLPGFGDMAECFGLASRYAQSRTVRCRSSVVYERKATI